MAIISELPNGASVLDLDAARVARAEARALEGKGSSFLKLAAGYVEVHPEVPIAAAYLFKGENIREGLEMLLVDPADIDILWPTLTAEDFQSVVGFITGKTPGESQA